MKILVVNSGSSSIKYRLFEMQRQQLLASGVLERIGESSSRLAHRALDESGRAREEVQERPVADHRQGVAWIGEQLATSRSLEQPGDLAGVGHRVVHGGEAFQQPVLIDQQVLEAIRAQIPLAPLHNPANLLGIEVTRAAWPDASQVAVFDTAFHQTLPPQAYRYALPGDFYRQYGVRRYGFHGTSNAYVLGQTAEFLGRPASELNVIVLHLGNGASATAIREGRSVDTSMGLTPLEGLVMGTRCGNIDPAVVFHVARAGGIPGDELERLLNEESGLKGLCGANDMREVLRRVAQGDAEASLAVELYAYRIRKYIGAYVAILGRLDALVFTAGIGENAAEIRARACAGLQVLGIELEEQANRETSGRMAEISAVASRVRVLVVPTNEELEIARQTVDCMRRAGPS